MLVSRTPSTHRRERLTVTRSSSVRIMRSLLILRRLQVVEVVVLVRQFCQNSRQKDKDRVVQGSGNNPFAPNSGRLK